MRIRAVAGSLLGGVALAFLVAAPALADEPVDLGSSPVLDAAGALDDAAAEAAIDETFDRTGVSLFVVVVDTFESPSDADSWTTATAERNGLGVDDILLAIAVEDRTYSLSADYATLSDAQYDAVLDALEPELRDSDWDGAVAAAAGAIADQLDPPFPVVPVAIGGGVVALGGIIAGGVAIARRRSANAGTRAAAKDLDTRAGSLLVQLDDAVKTSEQELGFAVAQFGEEPTAGFREALDAAKAQVKEAFEIRHRLDDSQPETAEERRTLTLRIIELCEAADDTLDAQDEAFDALRDLEKNAPQLIESVGAEQAELAARIDAAETTVADLRRRFGAPAVDAIDENPAAAPAGSPTQPNHRPVPQRMRLRLADPGQRGVDHVGGIHHDLFRQVFDRQAAIGPEVGAGGAGQHGLGPHALVRQFVVERGGEGLHEGLGAAIDAVKQFGRHGDHLPGGCRQVPVVRHRCHQPGRRAARHLAG